jgi:hypothetical protein
MKLQTHVYILPCAAREPAYSNCCGPFQKRSATLALRDSFSGTSTASSRQKGVMS